MLKDICAINMGQSPDSNSYNDEGYGLPFFQGNADFGERYPIAKKWCSAPQKIAKPEDILISVRAPIGAVNYAKEKCCIGRGLAAITLDKSKVSKEFIFWFLKSKNQELNNKGVGSTFKSIGRKVLEETLVPDLTKEKQMRYSEILEKLYFIIQSRMLQQKELDELVKARFGELFGDPYFNPYKWKKLKIADAVTVEPQNGLYKPQTDYIIDGTGIPILRIDCFYNGEVADWGMLKRLRCTEKDIKRYQLNDDDVVINRVNSIEYLGKCAHITGMKEKTVFESNMMRMHFDKSRFNPIYITKLLCTQYIHDQIIKHAKKAVNQASINQHDVMDFDIYLPPLNMQQEYANFVRQIAKSKLQVYQYMVVM